MIEIKNLTKGFEAEDGIVRAVNNVSLTIPTGSFFTLLGPSGCGKSTLLRCIAGLERPDSGEVIANEQTVFSSAAGVNVPTNKRNFGMVFQSYAIWPHMTVYENVAFPLEMRRRDNIKSTVMHALGMVGLGQLHNRYATNLSGGQQQRVALARAIVAEPELLLLDEPLSNLDAALRDQMRTELRDLQGKIGVTSVYVTHDQAEALSMSDQIAVMRDGEVLEVASPQDLYNHPRHVYTAEFLGAGNILQGTASSTEEKGHVLHVSTAIGTLVVEAERENLPGNVHILIQPENIEVIKNSNATADAQNVFSCILSDCRFTGAKTELKLKFKDDVTLRGAAGGNFTADLGSTLYARVDPRNIHVLRAS